MHVENPYLRRFQKFLYFFLFLIPITCFSQDNPFEADFSVGIHTLFGDGIDRLPEEFEVGLVYEGALQYRAGTFGLVLKGGFWHNKFDLQGRSIYDPITNTTGGTITYNQRLEDFSAHYLLFGILYHVDSGPFSLQIAPVAGVQRFYFPHFSAVAQVSGMFPPKEILRFRSLFGPGLSAGLGLKVGYRINPRTAINLKLDYLQTFTNDGFRYWLREIAPVDTNNNNAIDVNETYNAPIGNFYNWDPLRSLKASLGASFALGKSMSATEDEEAPSLAPTALDVDVSAGYNALFGKGIDNLPGNIDGGYNTDLTINYRLGRWGAAFRFGFWDNKYDVTSEGFLGVGGVVIDTYQRLDNLSSHYFTLGPIIPIYNESDSKIKFEVIPQVGIQRIYFPHSWIRATTPTSTSRFLNRVYSQLETGLSAGLGANILYEVGNNLSLKLSIDYISTITEKALGYKVQSLNFGTTGGNTLVGPVTLPTASGRGFANRDRLERIGIGLGLSYNLFKKPVKEAMEPKDIQEMIEEKEEPATDSIDVIITDPVPEPVEEVPAEEVVPPPAEPVPPPPPVVEPPVKEPEPIKPPEVVYRVQFVALSKDIKTFNELKQYGTVILEFFSEQGLYRYMVGDGKTLQEGLDLLDTIHNNGWPKAFLVKYENGVRTRVR
ncbi:MAG: SPOR domain-containing protein [Bacteroidia bacterium]|nr:SPOR domain-containing protein [Bacteroidia bacterium]